MGLNKLNKNGKQIEQQMRLQVRGDFGELDLVPIGRADAAAPLRWAWPGGGSVTYGEVVRLCRARDWPRPELLPARVVRRAETEEPPNQPTGGDTHGQ